MDVQSLYQNTDHKKCMDACSRVLDKKTNQSFPTRVIVKLIQLILKCNGMSFNGRFFHQIKGMAMSSPMAVSYAVSYMLDAMAVSYMLVIFMEVSYIIQMMVSYMLDTNVNQPYG